MKKPSKSKVRLQSVMQEGTIHMTPAQEKAFKREGIRVVLGGVIIHFVLGCFYLWGGISLYVSSYLRSYDEKADIDLVKMVFPLMFIGINAMLSLGVKLAEKIGYRALCTLGIICIAAAAFIVSFISDYIKFIIIYTLMIGLSSGLLYMAPVLCGWKYFPKKKGLVSGVIIAGYGLGSFTFNFIALALVNPKNEVASEMHNDVAYFSQEVYTRVPYMLKILSLLYLVIGLIGCFLIKMPKVTPTEHVDEHHVLVKGGEEKKIKPKDRNSNITISDGVKSRQFWLLFAMIIGASFFGLMMANNYKVYGLTRIPNDSFVTLVGSIGSISNGICRLIWAALYDRFGLKKTYIALLGLQTAIAATIDLIAGIPILYLVWHSITMATEGGQFSIMPVVSSKVFGAKKGPVIYGILYIGFSIANLSSFFLTKFALNILGWKMIFWICFGLSASSFAINLIFNESQKVQPRQQVKRHEMAKLPNSPELNETAHDEPETHEIEKL